MVGFTGGCFLIMILVIIASTSVMINTRVVPSNDSQIEDALNG